MDSKNVNIGRPADEVLEDFLSLSEEQTRIFLDRIIEKFSPSQLFYLDSRIEPNRHRDFIGHLPPEIVENIMYHMDLTTFTNCTMVCKKWNSIISSNSRLWQVACLKLGLSVKRPQVPDTVPDYKNIFWKMRARFQKMQNGEANFDTESIESADCLHYHKGIVAIGNKRTIYLWRVEPHLEFLLKIDTSASRLLTSLHFDDSFLVAGSDTGQLLVWKLPEAEMLYCQVQHTCRVFSLIFNADIDLLITSANCLTFWCLSTGQVLCSHDVEQLAVFYLFNEIAMQLHLVCIPMQQNGHDYMFMYRTNCRLSAYSFDSNCISSTLKDMHLNQVDLEDHAHGVLPNSHVSGGFLYFMTSSPLPPKSILYKWDIANGIMANEFEIIGYYVKLVGVGKKYACLLESPTQKQIQNLVIYDISTKTNFTTVAIPKSSMDLNKQNKLLQHGDTSWLDGFDGFNDTGVFLINCCKSNVTDIVRLLP